MTKLPSHIQWLIDTGVRLNTTDGKEIEVWEFRHQDDSKLLSEWAAHFRNQYCSDKQIDSLRSGPGKSRTQYLNDLKFPDAKITPGPSIRSGDFAEILIADYLEFICNYWVPRFKHVNKTIRNESEKGSDIIGFKITQQESFSSNDEMVVFEVKATFSDTKNNRLQDAINHSFEDEIRKAESLNALKQIFLDRRNKKNAQRVERFQNIVDNPFVEKSGAAAVLENSVFDKIIWPTTDASLHYNRERLSLIVIKGKNMMPLVHELYRRAADEA
jgi:hypothetical protein